MKISTDEQIRARANAFRAADSSSAKVVSLAGQSVSIVSGASPCFFHLFGKCSLDFSDEEAAAVGVNNPDVFYCRRIAQKLCSRSFHDYSSVVNFSHSQGIYVHACSRCGHWDVCNGNHRVCIARRLSLVLPIIIHADDSDPCRYCNVFFEDADAVSLYINDTVYTRHLLPEAEMPLKKFRDAVKPWQPGGAFIRRFGDFVFYDD